MTPTLHEMVCRELKGSESYEHWKRHGRRNALRGVGDEVIDVCEYVEAHLDRFAGWRRVDLAEAIAQELLQGDGRQMGEDVEEALLARARVGEARFHHILHRTGGVYESFDGSLVDAQAECESADSHGVGSTEVHASFASREERDAEFARLAGS